MRIGCHCGGDGGGCGGAGVAHEERDEDETAGDERDKWVCKDQCDGQSEYAQDREISWCVGLVPRCVRHGVGVVIAGVGTEVRMECTMFAGSTLVAQAVAVRVSRWARTAGAIVLTSSGMT